jgi:alkanesulfonate monooxygenase SsuD/methylene tetrahydromethanopterin reductase-like flavin-dependent oxidoreductase (luciferase family)
MAMSMLRQGRLIAVPPVETALRYFDARGAGASSGRRAIQGPPETVRAGLEDVAREYGADEVVVVSITYEHAARRRSYELIAEAFGLSPAAERQVADPA